MSDSAIAIDHVQITVPRALEAEARRFYGEVLRLVEIPKPEVLRRRGGAWFKAGPVQLHVSIEDIAVDHNMQSRRHVCYVVSDVAALRARLESFGLEIIADTESSVGTRFYVRDPAGNRIEIAQRV